MHEFINSTKNQHFISQAEQRLNSCSENPYSPTAKIHRFNIERSNPPSVSVEKAAFIEKNLAFQDLFTLLRVPVKERVNLEHLFGRYEGPFPEKANNLLKWIDRVKSKSSIKSGKVNLTILGDCDFSLILDDVKFIYKFKMMAGLRNPNKIRNTLADFGFILNHSLTDVTALALYFSLTGKNKSEEDYICKKYQVSSKEYKEWIRLLILFLFENKENETLLDGYVEEFFKAKELFTSIQVFAFDNGCALLPDTGIVKDVDLTSYMNVAKNCVIVLKHVDIGSHCDAMNVPVEIRKNFIEDCGGGIQGSLIINDKEILAGYNQICVQASVKNVFSGADEIAGVSITNIKTKN